MNVRSLLQMSILSLGMGLTVISLYSWSGWRGDSSASISTAGDASIPPDATASNVSQVRYDENGQRQYEMTAASLKQYTELNENRMTALAMQFYQQDRPAWQAKSNYASSDMTGTELELSGDVRIARQQGAQPMELVTDQIRLYPLRSFASSNTDIVFTQNEVSISAGGIEADLLNNHLVLKNRVTSSYQPEAK